MSASMLGNDKAPSYEEANSPSGIDHDKRRSVEDEETPLPEGWVRQWDPAAQHHYYVDTTINPPRSIWTHPYEDRQWLESQGHSVNTSDSESDQDNDLRAEKTRGPAPMASSSAPTQGDSSRAFGTSPAQFNNNQYSVVPQPQEMSTQTHGRGGIVGGLMTLVFGDQKYKARQQQEMQDRYMQRRMMFQQNGGVPANMAGPMYGGNPMIYAPPPMPYSGRGARRMEKDMRRAAKRQAKDQRKAIRHGYPVPMAQSPQFGQAPLFGYAQGRPM